MHIFFAERHVTGSDFVVETTISESACATSWLAK